jgi:hypothetical protein
MLLAVLLFHLLLLLSPSPVCSQTSQQASTTYDLWVLTSKYSPTYNVGDNVLAVLSPLSYNCEYDYDAFGSLNNGYSCDYATSENHPDFWTSSGNSMLILGDESVSEIKCSDDRASCVLSGMGLDGSANLHMRIIWIHTNMGSPRKFRSITFTNGDAPQGGAMFISGAAVTLKLCVFARCRGSDGGAIYVYSGYGYNLDMYGTTFVGNIGSDEGSSNDISDQAGVKVSSNTCPSPYEGYTPRQGEALNTNGATGFSYLCHEICNIG